MSDKLRATLVKLPRIDDLERRWRDLESRGNPSLFISWDWIGCWLESLPQGIMPDLLLVEAGGRTVGLGMIGKGIARHVRVIKSRSLYLNATGKPELDGIIIEYNGLLSERGMEREVLLCCIGLLLDLNDWDEWILPGVDCFKLIESISLSTVHAVIMGRGPCHYVDLEALRVTGKKYSEAIGKKTRYNINRGMGEFAKSGELRLDCADSIEDAHAFINELKQLHQRYWRSKGLTGAFARAFSCEFHRRFIDHGFPKGIVQLLRLQAGNRTVGCLYNFVYKDRVLCYQTGFDYSFGIRYNCPGLVTHALAVDFNLSAGYKAYDFLAGDAQYKMQLGTHSIEMYWISLQRNRLKFRVATWLRAQRSRLQRIHSHLYAVSCA